MYGLADYRKYVACIELKILTIMFLLRNKRSILNFIFYLEAMRPLNDEEIKVVFTKLSEYIGPNIKYLIEREDEPYVFRLIKDSVYYLSEELAKLATNIGKDQLIQ